MPRWIQPPPLELTLWYGDLLVADLHDVFPHQGTWFAVYELRIRPGDGPRQDQLLSYIAFCKNFHRRIADGQDHDFAEFDAFGPIPDTSSWKVSGTAVDWLPMAGRMWFMDDQASWEHPETSPSTEMAANEVWARIAKDTAANLRSATSHSE
jgi:hypothetical protein